MVNKMTWTQQSNKAFFSVVLRLEHEQQNNSVIPVVTGKNVSMKRSGFKT